MAFGRSEMHRRALFHVPDPRGPTSLPRTQQRSHLRDATLRGRPVQGSCPHPVPQEGVGAPSQQRP